MSKCEVQIKLNNYWIKKKSLKIVLNLILLFLFCSILDKPISMYIKSAYLFDF